MMNPAFPLPVLIPLAILVTAVAAAGSWRGSAGLPAGGRALLLGVRMLAVAAALLILFNPGRWTHPVETKSRPWVLLRDVSNSMDQPLPAGGSRGDLAGSLAVTAAGRAEKAAVPLDVRPFAADLSGRDGESPDAGGSRILPAVSQVLQDAASAGVDLSGIIVLSDGRQTMNFSQADLDALALRARGNRVPVHTVVIGADSPAPDLELVQPRASFTAVAGQPLRIPFALKSTGLSPLRPAVNLVDEKGGQIATITLDVGSGQTVPGVFQVKAPAASARWTMETAAAAGDTRPSNNRCVLNVRVLQSKTRVFLVEGAPYWDSKFLAQLLRQQPYMDVRSIHRLSDERYFRIDSASADGPEEATASFPDSLEELARHDLVVFGKNVDPFLNDKRLELLRSYVRDHGGALLFSRGKATTGGVAALEPLEPVVWASTSAADFRFVPNRDGEAAGLFGQALPAPDASLWKSLPTLKDGRQISMVKPFTRVLADGHPATAAESGKFPALLVRRYGQGVTGLVNGDGLWKWDFFPEARELGNCYEDFWTQLIQWMASYSEFLPGQDFSLRLPVAKGETGATFNAAIAYRGPSPVPQPVLMVTGPDGESSEIRPASLPDPSGRPAWRASFAPDKAGWWKLKLKDPRANAPETPEVAFEVPAAPAEADDLSPDPSLLAALSDATGGLSVNPAGFEKLLDASLVREPPADRESGAVWQASWRSAFAAIALSALFGTEWFLRRRQGLA